MTIFEFQKFEDCVIENVDYEGQKACNLYSQRQVLNSTLDKKEMQEKVSDMMCVSLMDEINVETVSNNFSFICV